MKKTLKKIRAHRQAQARYYRKPLKRAAIIERNARYRAARYQVNIERVNLWELFEAQKMLCEICFLPMDFDEISLDHIVPLAVGGPHQKDNVRLTHLKCNQNSENVRWIKYFREG